MSWRRRLRGEPREVWDQSLADADYATVAELAVQWAAAGILMRAWLESLSDDDLLAVVDLGNADRLPLWYYLVHVVTHSMQQRRDAALIIEKAGSAPPELDFLYYADSLAG